MLAFLALGLGSSAATTDPLKGNADERRLLDSLAAEKYIRAREQAEAILRGDPRSIIGRYGLGRVFHVEEGNLPRALFHLQRAERELLARYGARPSDPQAQSWHRRILVAEATLLGEMDRRHEQLTVLDRYNATYRPPLELQRIWPLMKLHRFDEALRIAKKATISSDLHTRIAGYNGRLSIEFERERPQACFRAAMAAVAATGEQSCVLNLNTAEAAFAVFRFHDVEQLALKSIRAPIDDCPSSAHPHLANLYLLRADFSRAIAAVKEARKQGVTRRLRQQFESGIAAWLMRLLFALGQFEQAHQLAQRVLQRPDRVGLISYSSELMEAIYTVDYYATLKGRIEVLRERAAARPLLSALEPWLEGKRLLFDAWVARRKASRLLAAPGRLRGLLRPYLKPLPSWHLPLLAEIVGNGVVQRALAQVRAVEKMKSATAPYSAAVVGEIAYRDGDWAGALQRAREALAGLPRDEVLLRGRVSAWAADAAYRLGDDARAAGYFHEVLHRWPTALRIHAIALPVAIEAGKSPLAGAVAQRLRRSPRLRVDERARRSGFVVRVARQGDRLRLCLSGARGRRYACAAPELQRGAAREEQITAAIDAFHGKVFAPLIDLTQQDINSLDGRAVRGHADEVLKEVFGR